MFFLEIRVMSVVKARYCRCQVEVGFPLIFRCNLLHGIELCSIFLRSTMQQVA